MPPASPTRYVALLRGINVGGNRRLPMTALRTACERAGCEDVATYIQSGNAVFSNASTSAAGVRDALEQEIARLAGFDVDVSLRTAAELAQTVRHNPFPSAGPTHLVVGFLRDKPPAGVETFDAAAFAPEEFVLRGRDLYLHLPNGFGNARITTRLPLMKLPLTARNWNTVTRLLDMVAPAP